jgi:hypothetical protein
MVDALASRYHLLPSEVLSKADSVDIYVMDAALTYRKYMEDEELHKSGKGPKPTPVVPEVQLQEMLSRVRSKSEAKTDKNTK